MKDDSLSEWVIVRGGEDGGGVDTQILLEEGGGDLFVMVH